MINKKLLSLNTDELKGKLVRFYFMRGGIFQGHESVEVIKNNDKIKYMYKHSYKKIHKKYNFSNKKWDIFTDKIFTEKIHKWKESYYNIDVQDGEEWELQMEFSDLSSFVSSGSNEYPNNWDEFIKVIDEYFPQMR
jgi:hypothetical protein